ncbi:sodium:alanine symporter family protein [Sporanaerobium hydrogeniformans]|uniref:Sodium:alanine symporter family protein n=1 Tax=Sporanaerobium hydrogeniformans TaxID=3072179 RepID=A0AC61DCV8_9FIRM|nr:sodium:alanine symporter family protein [Sporanaerobium hydrogeniformans]PHV70601.1 sodium:alanine symporter family protein [Sporanaerobium hydrogeniformans]
MDLLAILGGINDFIWGPPLIILLMATGVYLTVRLGLIQIIKLPTAFKLIFKAENKGAGDINSFGALCTALAATVGTGNIVGVATAIGAGGPGALFWMWLAAFFGMATKYSEGVLAIKYRTKDANGQISGGPMYYIENGLGKKFKPLAVFFAISGILVALLGIGTFSQVNAITSSIQSTVGLDGRITSLVMAVLVAIIVFGGIKSISKVAEKVVPFMAIVYIIFSVIIIGAHYEAIIPAFNSVFKGAFSASAAIGGFAGATVAKAIQSGIARGIFSNESGLGSAPIAAAAAKTEWPAEQGLISMTGTFIDTIIICTLTGLSIIVTGAWCDGTKGAVVTQQAFASVMPTLGPILVTFCLVLFAFTTILGWCYYGERCLEYLAGVKVITGYRMLFTLMIALGGFLELDVIWSLADIVNGLMAFPNLVALLGLSGVVINETKKYMKHIEKNQ